jgi:hypothetical protein
MAPVSQELEPPTIPARFRTLFDQVHMQDELSEIFGRNAHFNSWSGLVNSGNALRTDLYREAAHPLYVAG